MWVSVCHMSHLRDGLQTAPACCLYEEPMLYSDQASSYRSESFSHFKYLKTFFTPLCHHVNTGLLGAHTHFTPDNCLVQASCLSATTTGIKNGTGLQNQCSAGQSSQTTLFLSFVSSFLSQICSISSSSCLFDYSFACQSQSSAVAILPSSSPISSSVCESCQRRFCQTYYTTQTCKHPVYTHRHTNVVVCTYGWHTVGRQSIFSPVLCAE